MRRFSSLLICLLIASPGCPNQKSSNTETEPRAAKAPGEAPSPPASSGNTGGPTLTPGQVAKGDGASRAPNELRPLVTSLAAGDPIRLAIRWQHVWSGGGWFSRGPAGDTLKSFRITVKGRRALERDLGHMEAIIEATRGE